MGNLFSRKSRLHNIRKIYPSTSTLTNAEKSNYANNAVKTQKYNIITFIPKNLFEQFHRFANVYFVFILILNFLPEIQAFGREVAPIPVIFVLAVTAIKDAVEDFRRYKADQKVNQSRCTVYALNQKNFVEEKWSNLVCGDFVKLKMNETIPADIVLLHSTDLSGTCHIETSNLDGESNLKQREVVSLQRNNQKFSAEHFSNCYIEVEYPNQEIYKFNGTLINESSTMKTSLKKNNLLLRGCTLRNTEEVIGIVVYAGKETKAMLNNNDTRFKRSKLERQINKDVMWCVLLLILMCLSCSIGNVSWRLTFFTSNLIEFYKFSPNISAVIQNPAMQAFLNFWTSVIYYQALIPLPLYVTFEFVKLHQVFHIRKDIEMYDDEAKKGLEVRAFNIPEDLGQIQYIFCDKTGTLTENRMEFKRAFIDGEDYAEIEPSELRNHCDNMIVKSEFGDSEEQKNSESKQKTFKDLFPFLQGDMECSNENNSHFQVIKDFFLLMAICNTTVVSINKNEKTPVIKAKKPDLRGKIKRQLQIAGEGVMNKAASISSFNAKHIFTKSGRGAIKNSDNDEVESKLHDVVIFEGSNRNMELIHFTRRDSALPSIDIQQLKIVEDDHQDILQTPNKSRKVKSVTDFRNTIYNSDNDTNNHKKSLQVNFSDDYHLSSSNLEIHSEEFLNDSPNAFNVMNHKHDSESKCPISDEDLLKSYESESPDEMALVKTACKHGYKLLQRGPNFVTIWSPESERIITYNVLQILPFDSNRKRMSVIVKCPQTKEIILYCKGADSAMYGRFSKETSMSEQEDTQDYLDSYARLGLRTLVMAKRVVSKEYFELWHARYKEVEQHLVENDAQLSEITSEIEDDMQLLGVSGIEDCLQDGVPDTIDCLKRAGINVWILTGDKRETAINIAYSAKLFSDKQEVLNLVANSKESTHQLIQDYLEKIKSKRPLDIMEVRQGKKRPLIRKDLSLCVDGDTLNFAMDPDIKMDFLHLAEQCCSVVCARSTPIQKAEIVKLVKENLRMQTLAIGDGANDVSMIQMADVGIGIGGNEGMQAVMASDFAMTKFKYLKRLLLVHGSWCYNKLARTALYMFYKDTIFILLMFWYQFYNAFSSTVMIDQLTQILFNITMTGLPPIVYGIWDKDLHSETLMKNPELYRHGINCKSYKPWHFWINILDAVWQSLAIFFICYCVIVASDVSMFEFGQVVTVCVLITCLLHLGIETRFWTYFHVLGLFISFFLAWLAFTIMYDMICGKLICNDNPNDFIFQNFQRLSFWLLCFVTPAAAILPRLTYNAIINSLHPNILNEGAIREQKLGKGKNLYFSYEPELVALRKTSTFIGSVFSRPSVAEINLITSEYGLSETPNSRMSSKKQSVSKMSTSSGKINQSYLKSKRTKTSNENTSNHLTSISELPNVSPIHHEVTSFLIGNNYGKQESVRDGNPVPISNVNGGCVSHF